MSALSAVVSFLTQKGKCFFIEHPVSKHENKNLIDFIDWETLTGKTFS
jgi:hypothetical protein